MYIAYIKTDKIPYRQEVGRHRSQDHLEWEMDARGIAYDFIEWLDS